MTMDIVVLFGILALCIVGPRRCGRTPSPPVMICGALMLAWLLVAFGMGAIWNTVVGTLPQR